MHKKRLKIDLNCYSSIELLLGEIEKVADSSMKLEVLLVGGAPYSIHKITYPSRKRTIAQTILQIIQPDERIQVRYE